MIYMFRKYLICFSIFTTALFSCTNNDDEQPNPPPPNYEIVDLKPTDLVGEWEVYYATKEVFKTDETNTGSGVPYRDPQYNGNFIHFVDESNYYEKNPFGQKTAEGKYQIIAKDSVKITFKKYDNNGNLIDKDTTAYRRIARDPKSGTFVQLDKYMFLADNGLRFGIIDVTKYRNINNTPADYPNKPTLVLNDSQLLGSWIQFQAQTQIGDRPAVDSVKYHGSKLVLKPNKQYEFYNPPVNGAPGQLAQSGNYILDDDVIHFAYQEKGQQTGQIENKSSTFWIRAISATEFEVYERMAGVRNGVIVRVTVIDKFRKEN